MRITLIATAALCLLCASARADKRPVWISSADAPGGASKVISVVTNVNTGAKVQLGLWHPPFTGDEPLDVSFAPTEPRPVGWAGYDWLEAGQYRVVTTWYDGAGAGTALTPQTLDVQ